jgi:colanic acid/amylovoran biosynthesis glycosyltransferase
LIHAHFGPDGCLIAPIAKLLRVPLIVNFYGYDVSRIMKTNPEPWKRRYKKLFAQATALVAISEHIAGKLVAMGAPREKIRVIPLGIRLERFESLADRRAARVADADASRAPGTPPIVRCLHIGRLTAKKDPVGMITAFAKARALVGDAIDLRLDIVGDGPLRDDCHAAAKSSGHVEAIHFHGSVAHDRIPDLLVEADIYTQHCVIAPDGDMEGLGVTFMEASAAGLPIIGTHHNGIPEVVADGETGLLVDEHDYGTMAEHIVALARDPERRRAMGRAGMARAAERFTVEQMIDRVLSLHEEVAAASTRGKG